MSYLRRQAQIDLATLGGLAAGDYEVRFWDDGVQYWAEPRRVTVTLPGPVSSLIEI